MGDSKFPQVFKIYLIFLADLDIAIFCILSILSDRQMLQPLVTVLSALTSIGIPVIFMIHGFFSSLSSFSYLCHVTFKITLDCISFVFFTSIFWRLPDWEIVYLTRKLNSQYSLYPNRDFYVGY